MSARPMATNAACPPPLLASYKLLDASGLRVSELALGAMILGGKVAPDESSRIFTAFAEAGGTFVDTADAYGAGASERIVGELLGSDRDRFVLATKYTLSRDRSDPNGAGNHRKSLVHALDASLRRLRTDYVDLLWIHIWDFLTPVEEVMRALDDQVRAGKVLSVGVSDTPAWIVARANTIAAHHGWTPFTAVQVRYNLLERTVERDILPMTRALDLAVTAWGPLGHGLLAGRSDGRAGVPSERDGEIVLAVEAVAENMDATPAQVSLAWLRSRPGVVIPIVGASREAQMRDSLGALDLELDGDDRALLDRASAIDLGFPHEFTRSHRRTPFVLGDAHDRIDDHRADRSGLPLEPEHGMLTDA